MGNSSNLQRIKKRSLRAAILFTIVFLLSIPLLFIVPERAHGMVKVLLGVSFTTLDIGYFLWVLLYAVMGIKNREIKATGEFEDVTYKGIPAILFSILYIFVALVILSALVIPIGLAMGWK